MLLQRQRDAGAETATACTQGHGFSSVQELVWLVDGCGEVCGGHPCRTCRHPNGRLLSSVFSWLHAYCSCWFEPVLTQGCLVFVLCACTAAGGERRNSQVAHDACLLSNFRLKVPKHPAGRLVLSGHEGHHQRQQGNACQVEKTAQLGAQRQHTQAAAVQECDQEDDAAVDAKVLGYRECRCAVQCTGSSEEGRQALVLSRAERERAAHVLCAGSHPRGAAWDSGL